MLNARYIELQGMSPDSPWRSPVVKGRLILTIFSIFFFILMHVFSVVRGSTFLKTDFLSRMNPLP